MAVITISRQFGSAGLAVARRTAERLGYSCLDRTIVTDVARLANVSEQEIEKHDERGQSLFERLLTGIFGSPSEAYPFRALSGVPAGVVGVPPLIEGLERYRMPNRTDVLSLIEQVIRSAAGRGNVVIVGRGSQALLADWPEALHVRLVAPLEVRCRRIAEQEGIGLEEAMALIQATDRSRERYIRQHYGVDWEDPDLYHLMVNTGRIGAALAAEIISDAAAQTSNLGIRE
ncbi:MAG: hypothetical protein A3F84_15745 [Candidatus Handelsmanbacteria bacterium RIFCSPLOWO2_12_FULL_64_10]|uniref:Cytidylate kinase n=1 Tax=Handelsmanbacteria sp. (strain RIFCSPLOWO2_12_FULL_64_10) TaxID=1817868 RepID=A0A1F6D569_HANXR|nr:MAG: hypothetical protein A3F84_15745 [Candidatus Handelsmanbacteria bacterium RIFCSPLOWO2_12_FULL_64_10]